MSVAVKLSIRIGSVVSEAKLGAANKAAQASKEPANATNVIQFTYNDSTLIYSKLISGDR